MPCESLGESRASLALLLPSNRPSARRTRSSPGASFTTGDAAPGGKWNLERKRVLLTVGRMDARERYKGQDRVIGVLPQLVAAGHDVAYVVIGDGDDVPRLKSLAVETGVADRIHFTGAAGLETLVDAYRMADVFAMPSTGEGFGIAFLQAMACGTPVVGLATAGALDVLGDGELGSAVDKSELLGTLLHAIEQPKREDCVAAAVRARFGHANFELGVKGAARRLLNKQQRSPFRSPAVKSITLVH